MTGYCVKGEEQEKECQKARKRVLEKHNGKLPKKYERTSLDSCLYCPSFMES
jgi:hypothetical protein